MTVTYRVKVEYRMDAHPDLPEWMAGIIERETLAHFSVDKVEVTKEPDAQRN